MMQAEPQPAPQLQPRLASQWHGVHDTYRNNLAGIQLQTESSADFSGQDISLKFGDLLYSLLQNDFLKTLKLANCRLTETCLLDLFEVLKEHPAIETVNLTKNRMTVKTVGSLKELLESNRKLKKVYANIPFG